MNYRPEGLVGSSRFGMHFSLRPTLNHTLPSQFSNLIMLIASEAIHTSPSYIHAVKRRYDATNTRRCSILF